MRYFAAAAAACEKKRSSARPMVQSLRFPLGEGWSEGIDSSALNYHRRDFFFSTDIDHISNFDLIIISCLYL